MTLDFAGSRGSLIHAEGDLDLGIFGFFYVSGHFSFEKSEAMLKPTPASTAVAVRRVARG